MNFFFFEPGLDRNDKKGRCEEQFYENSESAQLCGVLYDFPLENVTVIITFIVIYPRCGRRNAQLPVAAPLERLSWSADVADVQSTHAHTR